MSNTELVLISNDLNLQNSFQTAIHLIGLSCRIIDNKESLSADGTDSEIVFFDPYNRFCSSDQLFQFRQASSSGFCSFSVLLTDGGQTTVEGFQYVMQRSLVRKELYRLLNELGIKNNAPDSSVWYQTVPPAKIDEFLLLLQRQRQEIEPVYRNGDFHYPNVERFFAGDRDDALFLLRDLASAGGAEEEGIR